LKISIWSQDTALGHAVLGEAYFEAKDFVLARTEMNRAFTLDLHLPEAQALSAKLGDTLGVVKAPH